MRQSRNCTHFTRYTHFTRLLALDVLACFLTKSLTPKNITINPTIAFRIFETVSGMLVELRLLVLE